MITLSEMFRVCLRSTCSQQRGGAASFFLGVRIWLVNALVNFQLIILGG